MVHPDEQQCALGWYMEVSQLLGDLHLEVLNVQ